MLLAVAAIPERNENGRPGRGGRSSSTGIGNGTSIPPWEPSAWLREAVARRLDQLPVGPATTIVTGLAGEVPSVGTRADRSCDRCDVYVPPTKPGVPLRYFTAGVEQRGAFLVVGLCRRCAGVEGWLS